MNFYINGGNAAAPPSSGDYYNSISTGAYNFKTLFDNVSDRIVSGDTIIVYKPDPLLGYVDDTASAITIQYNINIRRYSDDDRIVWGVNADTGVIFDAVVDLQGVDIHRENAITAPPQTVASFINIQHNYCTIKDVIFTDKHIPSVPSVCVYADTVSDSIISECTMHIENSASISRGIMFEGCEYIDITNNNISISGKLSGGVYAVGGQRISITDNIITCDDTTENVIPIKYVGIDTEICDNITISRNYISISGLGSVGVDCVLAATGGNIVYISNNVIDLDMVDADMIGIHATTVNPSQFIHIINNIIRHNGFDIIAVAINASIFDGIIDHNNLYKFRDVNKFQNNGNPLVIQEMGKRTISVEPRLAIDKTPTLSVSKLESYYCTRYSECIGSGYMFKHIGIDTLLYTNNTANRTQYVNIIDTVTQDLGYVKDNKSNTPIYNIFNSVFTEPATFGNTSYRHSDTDEPYQSIYAYSNQWDYTYTGTFPFAYGGDLYRKSFDDIMYDKYKLEPFPEISCPANPGYGYPDYTLSSDMFGTQGNYSDGLWGFPRNMYPNGCYPFACVVQDTVHSQLLVSDKIVPKKFTIQDSPDPNC